MLFNLRTRRGGTELAFLPAALSSCPSGRKEGIDSLLRKKIERKGVLFLWQGWEEDLDICGWGLCSDSAMALERCF